VLLFDQLHKFGLVVDCPLLVSLEVYGLLFWLFWRSTFQTLFMIFLKHYDIVVVWTSISNHIVLNFIAVVIPHYLPSELVQPNLVALGIELAVVAFLVKDHFISTFVEEYFSAICLPHNSHAVLSHARDITLLVNLDNVSMLVV
jgi:hypothetical protein